MEKCKETKFIEKYLNNELDIAKKMFIKKHLKTCPVCKKEFNELSSVDKFLSDYTICKTPQILNNKILNKIKEEKFNHKKNGVFSLAPLAASLIFAFMLGIYISNATISNSSNDYTNLGEDTFYSLLEDTK